jgi:hypothetical protein
MRDLSRTIRDRLRRLSPSDTSGVHFHQGPQGQPAPCFDEHCPNPRLSV